MKLIRMKTKVWRGLIGFTLISIMALSCTNKVKNTSELNAANASLRGVMQRLFRNDVTELSLYLRYGYEFRSPRAEKAISFTDGSIDGKNTALLRLDNGNSLSYENSIDKTLVSDSKSTVIFLSDCGINPKLKTVALQSNHIEYIHTSTEIQDVLALANMDQIEKLQINMLETSTYDLIVLLEEAKKTGVDRKTIVNLGIGVDDDLSERKIFGSQNSQATSLLIAHENIKDFYPNTEFRVMLFDQDDNVRDNKFFDINDPEVKKEIDARLQKMLKYSKSKIALEFKVLNSKTFSSLKSELKRSSSNWMDFLGTTVELKVNKVQNHYQIKFDTIVRHSQKPTISLVYDDGTTESLSSNWTQTGDHFVIDEKFMDLNFKIIVELPDGRQMSYSGLNLISRDNVVFAEVTSITLPTPVEAFVNTTEYIIIRNNELAIQSDSFSKAYPDIAKIFPAYITDDINSEDVLTPQKLVEIYEKQHEGKKLKDVLKMDLEEAAKILEKSRAERKAIKDESLVRERSWKVRIVDRIKPKAL